MSRTKKIRINGRALAAPLLIEDPDVRQTFMDASGQLRHVRSFSQPGRLKAYVLRHPEGMILAGVGNIFFLEPVAVSAASIRFDENSGIDIMVREDAERIRKQLAAMEDIFASAAECTY